MKMNRPWTPGPWSLDPAVGLDLIYGADHSHIAQSRGENAAANAHLIAASPALYEALEVLDEHYKDRVAHHEAWNDDDDVSIIISIGDLRKARTALSLARVEG